MVGVLLVLLRIPKKKPKPPVQEVLSTVVHSLDLPGFVLIAPAAIMFFLALQYGGNKYAWNSFTVTGLLTGAAVIFALFLIWKHRQGDNAMVPLSML